ncbi:siderophore-interacting protein [Curtobacterium sp. MCJR17_043]|nr:siderophore-interacting protein [Curtobacterium sp. MCJR17_043]WIB37044.1 siderophore-interacting protein [Curtobacterium sp. MCJR17_043]
MPSGAAEFAPGSANRILLAGDETAAPAICAILEALDVSAVGHVFIEVPTDADRLPVSAPAGVEVRWIARNGASHGVRMTDHVQAWASTVAVPAPVLTDGRAAVPVELADVDVDHQVLWDVPREDDDLPVYAWIAGGGRLRQGTPTPPRARSRAGPEAGRVHGLLAPRQGGVLTPASVLTPRGARHRTRRPRVAARLRRPRGRRRARRRRAGR